MKQTTALSLSMLLVGCSSNGYLARKSPEELSQVPDSKLCEIYQLGSSNPYAMASDMGKRELRLAFDEFERRGIPHSEVEYYCTQIRG